MSAFVASWRARTAAIAVKPRYGQGPESDNAVVCLGTTAYDQSEWYLVRHFKDSFMSQNTVRRKHTPDLESASLYIHDSQHGFTSNSIIVALSK